MSVVEERQGRRPAESLGGSGDEDARHAWPLLLREVIATANGRPISASPERLVQRRREVGNDVIGIFEAHGEPHEAMSLEDGGEHRLSAGGRPFMDDQCLVVAERHCRGHEPQVD